jgi:hypothetical protein
MPVRPGRRRKAVATKDWLRIPGVVEQVRFTDSSLRGQKARIRGRRERLLSKLKRIEALDDRVRRSSQDGASRTVIELSRARDVLNGLLAKCNEIEQLTDLAQISAYYGSFAEDWRDLDRAEVEDRASTVEKGIEECRHFLSRIDVPDLSNRVVAAADSLSRRLAATLEQMSLWIARCEIADVFPAEIEAIDSSAAIEEPDPPAEVLGDEVEAFEYECDRLEAEGSL